LHVKYQVQTATMIAKSKTAQINSLIQKRAKTVTPIYHFSSSLPSKSMVFNWLPLLVLILPHERRYPVDTSQDPMNPITKKQLMNGTRRTLIFFMSTSAEVFKTATEILILLQRQRIIKAKKPAIV